MDVLCRSFQLQVYLFSVLPVASAILPFFSPHSCFVSTCSETPLTAVVLSLFDIACVTDLFELDLLYMLIAVNCHAPKQ